MIKQYMHQPLFAYLSQNRWPVGSAYKYISLLMKHFGGVMLSNQEDDFLGKDIAVISDFRHSIKKLKPDLIFCRGDWLRYFELAIDSNIPYVLIEQDIHSLRSRLLPKQIKKEKTMIESAAGVIFTSEDHLTYCQKNYKVPDNHVVIHLRPLLQDLAWLPKKKLPGKHLVYAGGIIKNAPGSKYGYRCYKRIFKAFIEAGWTVHIYGSKNQYDTVRAYTQEIGVIPHGWFPYPELLQEMSQYTAGLQAYAKVDVDDKAFAYTQTCRPNKTWDYLAAGIPTIGLYPGNCAKIYQDGGWGIVVPDTKRSTLENIELPSFPENLRFEQVMDNDLDKLEKVVGLALKLDEKKIKNHWKEKGDEGKVGVEGKMWFRLTKPVLENGRLLHGRGKRIPIDEAIRLGLYKKETEVKKQIKKRVERKKKEKEKKPIKKEPKKKTVKVEVKPLIEPKSREAYKPRKISVPTDLEVHKKPESDKKERDN
jgi:hypothetical protein